jgi:hypothetical protein
MKRKILFIRYFDDILVLGKSDMAHFKLILEKLKAFLAAKGIAIKGNVQEFSPGKSFEYLSFKFLHTNYKNPKFALSKFTRVRLNSVVALRNNLNNNSRSDLLILIQQKSFKRAIFKIKDILSRKNIPLPVKVLIDQVNTLLLDIVNYFGHFQSTRSQLKYLDHLIYKRF